MFLVCFENINILNRYSTWSVKILMGFIVSLHHFIFYNIGGCFGLRTTILYYTLPDAAAACRLA
jgi:hypothetical protein